MNSTKSIPDHIQKIDNDLLKLERAKRNYSFLSIGIVILVCYLGISVSENSNAGSFARGISSFFDYPLDIISEAYQSGFSFYGLIIKYIPVLIETINMAVFSTTVGFIGGLIFSIFSARNLIKNPTVIFWVRRLMDVCRAFPELVIALLFLYLMGKSALPAVIAISIHTAGALGKLFSEAVENCDMKQIEGLESVGAKWIMRVRFGIIPQVFPILLSYTLLRLEINVRASTILGFVGAGGIGEILSKNIQWKYGADICAVILILVLTITAIDYLSRYFRGILIGDGKKGLGFGAKILPGKNE